METQSLKQFASEPALLFSISLDKSKKSAAWNFFGGLLLKKNGITKEVDKDHFYCKLCLQKAEKDALFKDIYRGLAKYKRKVSTGNLITHLKVNHEGEEETKRAFKLEMKKDLLTQRRSPFAALYGTPRSNASMNSDAKYVLGRDLALLCAQDNLPFNIVNGRGFSQFCAKYDIVAGAEDLPSERNIAISCLQDIYDATFTTVKKIIGNRAEFRSGAMAMDIWTDNHRHLSYQCHRLMYITSNFEMKNITLSTNCFGDERHTADNIRKEYRACIKLFDIGGRDITVVRDRGANVVRACTILDVKSRDCIAHGLHNLITVDGVSKVTKVCSLVKKARLIVKALTYRGSDLSREFEKQKSEAFFAIEELSELDQVLDADSELPIVHVAEKIPCSGRNDNYRMLKRDLPTRWNATYTMLESILNHKPVVSTLLCQIGKPDLVLDEDDLELMTALCKLLSAFLSTVQAIEGEIFPTLNVALLCRGMLKAQMEEKGDEISPIVELKQNLRAKFDQRFPRDDLMVSAALLDFETFRLKEIDDHLLESSQNRRDFLFDMIKKSVTENELKEFVEEIGDGKNVGAAGSSTANAQETENENLSDVEIPSDTEAPSEPIVKRLYSSDGTEKMSIKKKLLQQMNGQDVNSLAEQEEINLTIRRQVDLYFSLAADANRMNLFENENQTLTFWKRYKHQIPWVAVYARKVLALPATSAPAERLFSTTGLIVSEKRSMLAPSRVNKLTFIHDNNKLVQSVISKLTF